MASILPNFEYDIFISYRHNDNRSGWVTEFVKALQEELAATIKDPISIYFDQNPHDGLLEMHDVDDSLKEKLKCLIFIPIISQTYCDPKSFAWRSEFLVFLKVAAEDAIGLKVRLPIGNISSRVLPVRIHELDAHDKKIVEAELGPLRAIDFTYQSAGVNRPLRPKDDEGAKGSSNVYRDQINKTANAIKEIINGIQGREGLINTIGTDSKSTVASTLIESTRRKKWKPQIPGTKTLLVFCLLLIGILITALLYTNGNQSSKVDDSRVPIKTSINLPDSIPMSFMAGPLRTGRRAVDISPDGKTIVYVSMDNTGTSYLNIRPIGEDKVLRLLSTKGAYSPFFSPDSKWIAFFTDDKLMKISVDGSIMETLTQTTMPIDGIWDADDRIIWAANEGTSFNSIDSRGQDRKTLKSTMRFSSRPVQLSSDKYFATNNLNETYIVSFSKGAGKLILSNGSCQALYNHELIFMKGTDLFAVAFDENKQVTVGDPHLMEKGISRDAYSTGQFSISTNGTLVYANGTHTQMGRLAWRSVNGEISNLVFKPELFGTFSLSSDAKNLSIIKRGEQSEVWNYDLTEPKNNVQLSQQGAILGGVVWSPNSNWIYYNFYQNGKIHIARRDASGRSDAEVIVNNDSLRGFTDLDKDGMLLCMTAEMSGLNDIIFLSSDHSKIRYSFTSRKGVNESLAKFIPNDWLAFTSDQTGRSEVFISDLLHPAVRIQVSFGGGEEPRYHAADNTLYYRNGNKLMAIALVFDTSRKASLGASKIIFEDDNWINVPGYSYDISTDGKQFLLVRAEGKRGTNEIKVLQHFF
jgi:Tol biopolymer transport system component